MSSTVTTALGDTVAYDLRGSGPALIFVPGAGPFRDIDPVTTETAELAAAQGLTTVVPDRLGRGESRAEGDLTLERELAAIRALIDVAGGSAVLCGHSSGCAISLAAAVDGLPVNGLVLWEAPLGEDLAEVRAWIEEVERRLDTGDLAGALQHYMKDMPPELLAEVQREPRMITQAPSLRADGEALVRAESAPYGEQYGGLRIPVTCVVGEQTFPMMPAAAAAIAAAVPGGSSRVAPGAYHEWEPKPMADLLVELVTAAAR